jgi:hypothetical protein
MMECPHCHKEISGKACPACGAHVPGESRYCMDCGALLAGNPREEPEQEEVEQEDPFELDDRILCPDGNCTGIIIDGRCSECGNPYAESKTQE